MATAAIAKPRTESFLQRAVALIPGLLLLAAVGYAGKFIEQFINAYAKAHHTPFPDIEFVLWAIVIGLIMTFAGVGLRTNLRELGRQGWRPFAVGAIGEAFIAVLTLGLVYGADHYLKL